MKSTLLPVAAFRNERAYTLLSSVLLTVPMYFLTNFFIGGMSGGRYRLASSIYAGWLLILFFLMLFTGKVARYRRFFFVSSALLFFPSFISNLIDMRGSMAISSYTAFSNDIPFCHIVTPMILVPFALTGTVIFPGRLEGFAAIPMMLVIAAVAALTVGRGWCSWVCFYGGWDDGISRLSGRTRLSTVGKEQGFRRFSYAMLAFAVLGSLVFLSTVYCDWLCPFKLITEYEDPSSAHGFIAFIMLVLTFFTFVVVLPFLTRKRVQCGAFCPFGAFQSITGRLSPFRVRIDAEACTGCGKCVKTCPVFALSAESVKKGRALANCSLCGECIDACPRKAIGFGYSAGRFVCGNRRAAVSNRTERTEADPAAGPGRSASRIAAYLEAGATQLFSAKTLFVFSAYSFGVILCGSFSTETVARFVNLVTAGSFALP